MANKHSLRGLPDFEHDLSEED